MTGPRDYRNRPCRSCGRTTTRAQCLDCYLIDHPATYSPDHALTGGQWMPGKHGVLHWVEDGTVPPPEPDTEPEVACTDCGVKPTQACQDISGKSTKAHTGRIIPRQCKCGGVPIRMQLTCQDCQDKRASAIKRRAKRKRDRAERRRQDDAA